MTTNNAINVLPSNKNLIIGGDFSSNPWQRGTSFVSPIDNAYTADMFNWTTSGAGAVTITKAADAPTVAQAGIFTDSCMSIAVTTADASLAATDRYAPAYRMEGYDWAHVAQRICSLTFWVKSTKTGIFCVGLGNLGLDRSFISEYTINTTDTWEFKQILIDASPSAGTWNYTNDTGLRIRWALAMGTDFQGVSGWQTGNLLSTANQVNAMDSNTNVFKVTLIKIEGGKTVTPFELENESVTLMQSQRYFYKTYSIGTDIGTATTAGSLTGFTVTTSTELTPCMSRPKSNFRTTPTVTWYSTVTGASGNIRNVTAAADAVVGSTSTANETSAGFPIVGAGGVAANRYAAHMTADASLG